jgi:hypothetical protein
MSRVYVIRWEKLRIGNEKSVIGQVTSGLPITLQAANCAIQYRRVGPQWVCCNATKLSLTKIPCNLPQMPFP